MANGIPRNERPPEPMHEQEPVQSRVLTHVDEILRMDARTIATQDKPEVAQDANITCSLVKRMQVADLEQNVRAMELEDLFHRNKLA